LTASFASARTANAGGGALRQRPIRGAKCQVTLAGPCPSCRLRTKAKRHASHAPVSLQMESQSLRAVARSRARRRRNEFQSGCRPWRVPGLVIERTGVAKIRNRRQPPQGRNQTAWHPRRDTKTLFALHPLKSVLVSRPLAGLFSILHARALLPPAALEKAAQPRRRVEHPVAYLSEPGRFARIGNILIRN